MGWRVYNFECADESARAAFMDWIEANHPVTFPDDRYSVFAEVETDDGTTSADYAWVGRYLYVTVMGEAEALAWESTDRWERLVVAEFDSRTETATSVTYLDATLGEADEIGQAEFQGLPERGGFGAMYALAMQRGFRFRSYSAESPTTQLREIPSAFSAVEDVDAFVDEFEEETGIEPTEEGLALLRDDPADDDRYVYGETYGPVDRDDTDDGVDAVRVVDAESGDVATYEDADDVPDQDDGFLDRVRELLGG